jgi:methionine-rich copper-binding protein CopC
MSGRRIAASRLGVLLGLLVIFSLSAAAVSAHETTVTQSDPADGSILTTSPTSVTAQFTEELDTKGSTMIVVDAAGRQFSDGQGQVDLNDPNHATMIATVSSPLAAGVYTVKWHALLTDGDASDGSFGFTVQAAAAPAQAEATAAPAVTEAPAATEAPPATSTAAPEAVLVAAQATPDAPSQLPTTGYGSIWPGLWAVAAIAGALIILALGAVLRRASR